ncbi:MAG: hypothetical protein IJ105_02445 [Bacilli bacterium]|nr:hypothetical protein [Bacilli bacterium]
MYNDNRKTVILILLGIVIVSISIAYASLATNLNIGGTISSPSANWDIHFINFSSSSTPANTTSGQTNTGEIKSVSTSGTSINNLKAELKKPGDSIVYTFDIKNFGNIDAKLTSFNSNITCGNDCSHANFLISCLDSNSNLFQENNILHANETINCTLSLKFNDDASISDDVSANISANWIFSQN